MTLHIPWERVKLPSVFWRKKRAPTVRLVSVRHLDATQLQRMTPDEIRVALKMRRTRDQDETIRERRLVPRVP